jgi:hypothetical protein
MNVSTLSTTNKSGKSKTSPIKQIQAPASTFTGKIVQSLRSNESAKVQSTKSVGKNHTVSLSGGKNQTTPTGSNSTKISSGRENSGSHNDQAEDDNVQISRQRSHDARSRFQHRHS